MDWRALGFVALGGALGAALRYGVGTALPASPGAFPWATLAVNLLGSLAIGALVLPGSVAPDVRSFVVVGVLGGFTTLSTFSAESLALMREGAMGLAFANVAANGIGGPAAAFLGWRVALAFGAGASAA